jgi:1,4-dihydroxy-2-naphthoyl-CoA hydrolase
MKQLDTKIPLSELNAFNKNTLIDHLGIEITGLEANAIIGTMPVDHRTVQPMRLLHGGAIVALMETLGSLASSLLIDRKTQGVVGVEINANHIRSSTSGIVTGKAVLVHGGRKSHVWQIDVHNEENKLVSTGRLTVMVIDRKG